MADQDITVPDMDSTELFQAALADEPQPVEQEKPVAEAKPEQTTEERPRDEQGRFVPRAEADKSAEQAAKPEVQPQPDSKDDPATQIPVWRAREITEARKAAEQRANEAEQYRYALEQQMQEMRSQLQKLQQPKADPVDFFQNPEEAFQQRTSPIEERIAQLETQVRLSTSRAVAVATHGAAKVAEMDQAIAKAMREGNPEMASLRAQLQVSDDPVGLAIQWHQRSKLWEMTGGDPDKYREKILADAMKDPKYQAQVLEAARATAGGAAAQNGSRPNIQLPPSLNKAGGSAANDAAAFTDADMSDRALFSHATQR